MSISHMAVTGYDTHTEMSYTQPLHSFDSIFFYRFLQYLSFYLMIVVIRRHETSGRR